MRISTIRIKIHLPADILSFSLSAFFFQLHFLNTHIRNSLRMDLRRIAYQTGRILMTELHRILLYILRIFIDILC